MENKVDKLHGQKEYYDFDSEYFLAEDEKGNLVSKTKEELLQMQKEGKQLNNIRSTKEGQEPKSKEEAEELTRTANIAKTLGVSEDKIMNVIEIKEQDTKTALADKDKRNSQIFTVKLKQDSEGRGSHDWVAVEVLPDGTYQEVAGQEKVSEPMAGIAQELSIKDTMQDVELNYGEIKSDVKTTGERNIEVRKYQFQDEIIVLAIDREHEPEIHAFKKINDGVLEPMCTEHIHEDTIDLSDKRFRNTRRQATRTNKTITRQCRKNAKIRRGN